MYILEYRTFILIQVFVIINTIVFALERPDYFELLKRNKHISEDGKLDFMGLATKYGHRAEEHYVITEDGYNLTLFHIPGCRNTTDNSVLLIHGATVDADCFIIRGRTSLAITLADRCYDVWVLSMRGTIYSQRHVTLDPVTQPHRFFDYSFYEMGVYDLPATVDYVLEATKQRQVLTVGYSIGTTAHFVMGSEKPSYNKKIKAYLAFAPFCFVKHVKGLLRLIIDEEHVLNELMPLAGSPEFIGRDQLESYLLQSLCLDPDNYDLCVNKLVFGTFGPDEAGFEPEFMRTFFSRYPGGCTKKLLLHVVQMLFNNEFAKYDYGAVKNLEMYKSVKPPRFNLSKMTMRVALFAGKKDYIATVKDVEKLAEELPNVVHHQIMPYENFTHFDFGYGRYMQDNLYPYVFEVIEKYI